MLAGHRLDISFRERDNFNGVALFLLLMRRFYCATTFLRFFSFYWSLHPYNSTYCISFYSFMGLVSLQYLSGIETMRYLTLIAWFIRNNFLRMLHGHTLQIKLCYIYTLIRDICSDICTVYWVFLMKTK